MLFIPLMVVSYSYGVFSHKLQLPPLTWFKLLMSGDEQNESFSRYYYRQLTQHNKLPQSITDVLFVGDSIIDEFHVSEVINLSSINRGLSGDTSGGLLSRLPSILNSVDSKVVVVLIGTNDVLREVPLSHIKDNLIQINEILRNSERYVVIIPVLQMADYRPKANKYSRDVNKLLLRDIQEEPCATSLDISSLLSPTGFLLHKYTDDGVHLNADGYLTLTNLLNKLLSNRQHCKEADDAK